VSEETRKDTVALLDIDKRFLEALQFGLLAFQPEQYEKVVGTKQRINLPKEVDEAFDKFCYAMRKKGRPITKPMVYGWIIKNWLMGSPFDEPKLAEKAGKLKWFKASYVQPHNLHLSISFP
jgi:hypothetical protein